MYTLSFINQKGGVGKTTLSMNTAVRLKMAGAKVLLVDMDPQCSLTYTMGVDAPRYTIWDVLQKKVSTEEAICHGEECDILPASPNLSLLERSATGKDKTLLLRKALEWVSDRYQFVVVDTPPAMGMLMLNVIAAADSIVIPALPDIFSLQGLGQLAMTIRAVRQECNPGLVIDGILLAREETKLSQDMETMLKITASRLDTSLFETNIRRTIQVQEAQALRKSIYAYAPDSLQAGDMSRFTLEYLNRLRGRICKDDGRR